MLVAHIFSLQIHYIPGLVTLGHDLIPATPIPERWRDVPPRYRKLCLFMWMVTDLHIRCITHDNIYSKSISYVYKILITFFNNPVAISNNPVASTYFLLLL